MGQQRSLPLKNGGATPISDTPGSDPTEGLSLAQPCAAVVGAGVAGVHVAYELAKIGFKVTVFERRGTIAGGETKYSLPYVGVGLLEPSFQQTVLRSEIVRGMLFPRGCPDLIAREHFFHTLLNPVVYRWMWGRWRSCFSKEEVLAYTNNLSCLSHTVVCDLLKKHPHLQEHVFTGPITVLTEERAPAVTAHVAPMAVDPVGWTQGLAEICAKQYDVQFALGERVEDTTTYLKYDVESMKSIRLSRPDPSNPEKRVFANASYDVVVLAAGASTGEMTIPNSRLPVLGLSGLSAVVQQPSGEMRNALWSLFQRKGTDGAAESTSALSTASVEPRTGETTSLVPPAFGSLATLSGPCSLYGFIRSPLSRTIQPSESSAPKTLEHAGSHTAAQEYVLQGLLSLDTTRKTKAHALVSHQLQRLESYIRLKSGCSVPLSAPSSASFSTRNREESDGNDVHIREYVRAFTPDGVPIVDHNGGAFNCFVCCGFGDHAMDFAPGAAKVLGKLVEHRAHVLREKDLEQVSDWGVLASRLTPSQRERIEDDLQLLFNGVDPESTKSEVSTQAADTLVTLSSKLLGNPYSTDRFTKLVPKESPMFSGPTWLDRISSLEEAALTFMEPLGRSLRLKATEVAQRDNMPSLLRSLVFCFLYDENDDPEALQRRQQHEHDLQQLAMRCERSTAAASSAAEHGEGETMLTPAQRSTQRQMELERRARDLFNTGK